jgi:phosphomannomutase
LALEIYHYYRIKNMDFVDILEQEIYPKFGWWFGKTDSFTFDALDWKGIISAKMDMFINYKEKTFVNKNIKKITWNTNGDCLDWLLENGEWIRFRKSGTEPKFKIYYNLYGDSGQSLAKEYELLHNEFTKQLGV